MPNIREYTNKIDGLQTTDRASSAAANAARTAEWAGEDIGQSVSSAARFGAKMYDAYQEHVARQEISHGQAASAQMQALLTSQWQEEAKNADPNDPSVAEKWTAEYLDPLLDDWQQSFHTEAGKQWAATRVAGLKQHFFERTAVDQSTLAGAGAVKNIRDFTAGASNTAQLDPSSVNSLLRTADEMAAATADSFPHLTPEQAAKVKGDILAESRKEILKGGFIGMARSNPEAALTALDKGYGATELNADDRDTMRHYAEEMKRAQATDQRAAVAAAKAQRKSEADQAMAGLRVSMWDPKTGDVVPVPGMAQKARDLYARYGDVLDQADFGSLMGAYETAVENKINGKNVKSDNATWQTLASQIGGGLTHDAVNRAQAAGKLSNYDAALLNRSVDDRTSDPGATLAKQRFNAGLEQLKNTITKSNPLQGKLDPDGDKLFYQFYYDAWKQYDNMTAAGMSPLEAADKLLDPRSPQSIFNQAPRYTKSMDQSLQSLKEHGAMGPRPQPTPAPAQSTGMATKDAQGRTVFRPIPQMPPPRKPGESPAAYLERTKK